MNIIVSFSYKGEKEPIVEEFKKIAAREGKDKSKLLIELIEEYVKNHSEGNSTFSLDHWQQDPEFQAVPTLFSSHDKWKNYVNAATRNDKLKLLKSMTEKRDFLCARMNAP